jgi:hypothetical protein
MLKRLLLVCGLALVLVPAAYALAGASITLDQPGPAYGQQITFTVVSHESSYMLLVECYQNQWGNNPKDGGRVYAQSAAATSTGPKPAFTLANATWTGGAATCTADVVVWVHNNDPKILSRIQFDVTA